MVRSNLMDAVTYERRNQKLGIIIKKLKRAAEGASIKKNTKRGGTRLRHIIKIIYLLILLGNFDFCQVLSC